MVTVDHARAQVGRVEENLKQKPVHPSLTETIFMLILTNGYESLSNLQGIIPSALRDNSTCTSNVA